MEKHVKSTLGLFIDVLPDQEIASDQTYKICVVVLMHQEYENDEEEL
ncbi:hypothetical protein [Coxiella endosymbiont of Ornithodoros maritimus]|nr:hypothetical protein [Coxiella endosymbiont of Ornithodoros maritimus]